MLLALLQMYFRVDVLCIEYMALLHNFAATCKNWISIPAMAQWFQNTLLTVELLNSLNRFLQQNIFYTFIVFCPIWWIHNNSLKRILKYIASRDKYFDKFVY